VMRTANLTHLVGGRFNVDISLLTRIIWIAETLWNTSWNALTSAVAETVT